MALLQGKREKKKPNIKRVRIPRCVETVEPTFGCSERLKIKLLDGQLRSISSSILNGSEYSHVGFTVE